MSNRYVSAEGLGFVVSCCTSLQVALGTSPNCLSKQYQASAGDKFGWQNGLTSRCVPVTWLFNTYAYQFPDSTYKDGWRDSMCYKSSCNSEGVLQLDILGNKINCPSGQMVDLSKVRWAAGHRLLQLWMHPKPSQVAQGRYGHAVFGVGLGERA